MGKRISISLIFAVLTVITPMRATSFMKVEALGAEIPASSAIRAILGEASGEGYRGMLAVACGIRNRGTLKGVYGLQARHVDREPAWVWDLARKAWEESALRDIVGGADHWESINFKKPSWARNMIITARIGKHVFYRRSK